MKLKEPTNVISVSISGSKLDHKGWRAFGSALISSCKHANAKNLTLLALEPVLTATPSTSLASLSEDTAAVRLAAGGIYFLVGKAAVAAFGGIFLMVCCCWAVFAADSRVSSNPYERRNCRHGTSLESSFAEVRFCK